MNRKRFVAVALLLCLMVSSTGCDAKKIRQARKAAYRIQVIIDSAVDSIDKLNQRGVLSNADTLVVAKLLKNVNGANKVLIERAAAATEDTPAVRTDLLNLFREVSKTVALLRQHRILNIKDPEVAAALDAALAALDISLAAIELALTE